jgi:MFS family permease
MPESPRFVAEVRGNAEKAAAELREFSSGVASASGGAKLDGVARKREAYGLRQMLSDRRVLRLLLGTAGSWLLFDYAYYGNTLSLPAILKDVSPTASVTTQLVWSLAIFIVFAVPGYVLAFSYMDRIGHRKLQLIGFSVMATAFLVLGLVPGLTAHVAPFLAIFGISYLFIEFGPNSTTFVLPSELFPLRARTTGHGISAGVGKLGAFLGVFLVPSLETSIGLRGMLIVASGSALLGIGLTMLLPEPARRSLDELSAGSPAKTYVELEVAAAGPPTEGARASSNDVLLTQL